MQNSHLGGTSSDAGIVTRSLATLNQGIVDDQQVTVPCTIKLDKLSQSTEKLQLKDDKGYYTLVKEETQRYTIKDIRILRTRNRSLSGHKKQSSQKMSWPRQNFSHYSPSQSSGNKRPFHSPPDDYSNHHRYENKYNRHGYDSRESRGARSRGAYIPHRDRGKFPRSSRGSHYGNKMSYSSEGYYRDNRSDEHYSSRGGRNFRPNAPIDQRSTCKSHSTRNNESHGIDTKSVSVQPKNATHRNIVENSAKTPETSTKERNERDTGNSKSVGNAIAQNSKKVLSGSDLKDKIKEKKSKGVLTMSEQIALSRRESQNSKCKHEESSNCLSEAKSEEVHNRSDSSLRAAKKETACNSGSKRSSEHLDGETPSGLKLDQIKQEGKQEQEAESVKSEKSPAGPENNDSTEDAGDTQQTMEINVSNHEVKESRESNNESQLAAEIVRQSTPAKSQVKVHSARKSAPSSALSRTQRKKMLSRQKLLMSNSLQVSEKDESGGPKALMGSRHSDSVERETEQESQKSCTENGSKLSSDRTEHDFENKLTLPSSDAAPKSDAKGPVKEGAPPQQSEESKSNSSSGGCILREIVSKMPDVKETDCEQESGAVKQAEMELLSKKLDSEKSTGVKIKDNALQKIKENLKKNLQKGHHLKRPKKEHGHLVDESSSSSASTRAVSPELQNGSEMSLSPVSSIESIPLEDNCSEHSSNILDGAESKVNHDSIPVLPNVVSDVLANDMLDSPSQRVDNVGAVEREQTLPIQSSSEAEISESAEAVKPITSESTHGTSTSLEGSGDASAENDTSAAGPADKSIVSTPVEDKEESLSSFNSEADLDDISVDLGPEEPDDMNAIDDDILYDDPPEASQDHSDDLEICCIESHSTEMIETESESCASKRPLPSGDNTENSEPVSKKRKEDVESVLDDLPEEAAEAGDVAPGEDKTLAGERPVEVVDLDSGQSTCNAEQRHEEMIGNLDTSGTLVFSQKEWKDLYNSIIDKYKTLIENFQEKTTQVTQEQEQWKVRYDSLAKDYAELRGKYEELNAHVKELNSSPLKRSVDVQTETMKGTFSRTRKRHKKQASGEEVPNQETQAAIVQTTSSGTPSPSTSEHKSDAAGPSPKNSNLESKRQNFQAILSKALQSKTISTPPSEVNEVPTSLPDHSPSPGIEVPSPNRPHSTTPEVASGTDPAAAPSKAMHTGSDEVLEDAPKQDKVHGPQTSESDDVTMLPTESQEPNAANTASGKEKTARSQEPSSHASKAPSSSNDTSSPTKLSSTNQQGSPSKPPQTDNSNPTVHSSDTSKGPSVTEPDVPKVVSAATSTSSSSLSSSASPSKTVALPANASSEPSTSADPAGGKSSKRSDEPEIIDLTDEPDPPASAPASVATVTLTKPAALPSSKHATLITRSPHVLVLSPPASASMSKAVTRIVTNSSQSNRVVSALSQSTTSPVQQAVPSGTMHGNTRPSPNTSSTMQVMNVNPPAITSMGQGPNLRNQVVTLQHGQVQRVTLNNPATISQGNSSQVLSVAQQQNVGSVHLQNVSTSLPATAVSGVKVIPNKPGTIRQLTVPQQQQISLQMLQQQRQGIHQLPGAAASAAALATRQPQTTWINQTSQQLPSGAPQVQIVQQSGQTQINLTPQVQVFKPPASSAVSSAQTLTTSALQARPKQFQVGPRGSISSTTQEQIQAQERARTLSQMQAKETALRQQREQETLQAARQAAARLQSSQVGQQEAQQAQLRKLQEEKLEHQKRAQQSQSRSRMIREHLSKVQEYQRSLKSKLKSLKPQGIDMQEMQKQLKDVQEQEKKLSQELALVEERRVACNQQNNKIEQQLRLISTSGLPSREQQPQQFNQQQLQQQQLQQRNRTMQQNQADQRQQQSPGQSKHPAELPDLKLLPEVPKNAMYTVAPLKPILEIRHSPEGIVLSWKADPNDVSKIEVKKYLLYAYQESESTTPSTDLWKKIGAVEALPLPMACTLTHFKAGSMYHFAVGAISKHGRPGKFSNIGSINLP